MTPQADICAVDQHREPTECADAFPQRQPGSNGVAIDSASPGVRRMRLPVVRYRWRLDFDIARRLRSAMTIGKCDFKNV